MTGLTTRSLARRGSADGGPRSFSARCLSFRRPPSRAFAPPPTRVIAEMRQFPWAGGAINVVLKTIVERGSIAGLETNFGAREPHEPVRANLGCLALRGHRCDQA